MMSSVEPQRIAGDIGTIVEYADGSIRCATPEEMRTDGDVGHVCPCGYLEDYQRVDLSGGVIVQVGICGGCHEVVARRYVVTGSGTGPWFVLSDDRATA